MKIKPTSNPSNLIGNFLAGAFLVLIISGISAFFQYDGVGHIKTAWNDFFKAKNISIVTTPTPTPKADCQRVYSGSQNKFIEVCKKTRSEALTDCSKKSRESLMEVGTSLKNVDDLEKFRELMMKMCMQEAGFDY